MIDEEFVAIHRSVDPIETTMLCEMLQHEGIHARHIGTRHGAGIGSGQFILKQRIEVPQSQVEAAKVLLSAMDQSDEPRVDAPLRSVIGFGAILVWPGGCHLYARRTVASILLGLLMLGAIGAIITSDSHQIYIGALLGLIGFIGIDAIGGQRAIQWYNQGERLGRWAQLNKLWPWVGAVLALATLGGWFAPKEPHLNQDAPASQPLFLQKPRPVIYHPQVDPAPAKLDRELLSVDRFVERWRPTLAKESTLPKGALRRIGTTALRASSPITALTLNDTFVVAATRNGWRRWRLDGTFVSGIDVIGELAPTAIAMDSTGVALMQYEGDGPIYWSSKEVPDWIAYAHQDAMTSVGDDKILVARSGAGTTLEIYQRSGELTAIKGHIEGPFRAVTQCSDGRIATLSRKALVITTPDGEVESRPLGLRASVGALHCTTDNQVIAIAATAQGPATLYMPHQSPHILDEINSARGFALSDNSLAAIGTQYVRIFQLDGTERFRVPVGRHSQGVALSLTHLAVSEGHAVGLYDLKTGKRSLKPIGHRGGIQQILVEPESEQIAVLAGGQICLWTLEGQQKRCLDHTRAKAVAWSLDGSQLAVAEGRSITLYGPDGERLKRWEAGGVAQLQFSTNGYWLLMRDSRHTVGVYDIRRDKEAYWKTNKTWYADGIGAGRRRFARLDSNGEITVFTLADGKKVRLLPESGQFAIYDDQIAIATLTEVIVRRMLTGKEVRRLPNGANHLAWSSNGRWIVTAEANEVRIWNLDTGSARRHHADQPITAVAIKDDGTAITGSGDTTLLVWPTPKED